MVSTLGIHPPAPDSSVSLLDPRSSGKLTVKSESDTQKESKGEGTVCVIFFNNPTRLRKTIPIFPKGKLELIRMIPYPK